MTEQSTADRLRVLVLYGGQSAEHPVSCVTAAGVLGAVDGDRFEMVPVGITRDGQWTLPTTDPRTHAFVPGEPLPEVVAADSRVVLHSGPEGTSERGAELLEISAAGEATSWGHVDVVFPLLHGPFGEDGSIQGLLEAAGVPYVGAGILASAVGMDKHFMKMAFSAAGLRVGDFETVTARQWTEDRSAALERVRRLRLPVFVKPARGGSSVGITRVDDWAELDRAMQEAREHDPKVVVEEGIDGREIECAVLGGRDGAAPRASLPGEIDVHDGGESHQFYDFSAKYTDGTAADLSCPADLPEAVLEEVRRQAVVGFEAVDAEGISRVDFFVTEAGEPIINEINTMPGFTPISMYPQMWQASGVTYPELITELITLAAERSTGLR
ncbi:MAG: D-alanine--D-alanine ligase family protein [Nesterenkonia sp.]|uniref:D-alanine--D-alanine ligase family protein n=1 Tax=Nesterenkonia marinintestina TaxID=2979865 RepID=UPI0021C00EB1|nr:D-alanine--D-alanine ligase family protein [Nesterenkonia sp. GX14115]MDO5492342.1 D-alanine--D-alanine ligase family protein [Nesterenkonia sp.]